MRISLWTSVSIVGRSAGKFGVLGDLTVSISKYYNYVLRHMKL